MIVCQITLQQLFVIYQNMTKFSQSCFFNFIYHFLTFYLSLYFNYFTVKEFSNMFDGCNCNLFKVQYFNAEKSIKARNNHTKSDSRLQRQKYLNEEFNVNGNTYHQKVNVKAIKHEKMSIKQLKEKNSYNQNGAKHASDALQHQQKVIDNKKIQTYINSPVHKQQFNPGSSCLAALQINNNRQRRVQKNKSHHNLRQFNQFPNFQMMNTDLLPYYYNKVSIYNNKPSNVRQKTQPEQLYYDNNYKKSPVSKPNISFNFVGNSSSQVETVRTYNNQKLAQQNKVDKDINSPHDLLFSFNLERNEKNQQKTIRLQKKLSKASSTPNITLPLFSPVKKVQKTQHEVKIFQSPTINLTYQQPSKLSFQFPNNPEASDKKRFKHQISGLKFRKRNNKVKQISSIKQVGSLKSIQSSIPQDTNPLNTAISNQLSVKSLEQIHGMKSHLKKINQIKSSFPGIQKFKIDKIQESNSKQIFRPFTAESKKSSTKSKSNQILLTPPINQYPSEQSLIQSITNEDLQFQLHCQSQNKSPKSGKNIPLTPKMTQSQIQANQNGQSGHSSIVLYGMARQDIFLDDFQTKKQQEPKNNTNFLHPNYQNKPKFFTSIDDAASGNYDQRKLEQPRKSDLKGWISGNKLLEQVDIHESNYMHINTVQSLIQKKGFSSNNSPSTSSRGHNWIGRDRGYFESIME